jgi:glycosyltransferase involved in cell wall biosynthesis
MGHEGREIAHGCRRAIAAAPGASIVVSGPVDDAALVAAFGAADLFVLPSRYEGYGIVFAEALSFGLPVLACGIGPVPRLVGTDTALLVQPGDAGALSDALDFLLGDRGLRSRMSAAARRRAAALPRWEETVSGCYEVLWEAASRGPDPARRGRVSL